MPSVQGVSPTVAVTLAFKRCYKLLLWRDESYQLHTHTFNYKKELNFKKKLFCMISD